MRKIDVVPVAYKGTLIAGHSVQISYLPGSDEMWEVYTHAAVFDVKAEAEDFANKIRKACGGDLQGVEIQKHWLWSIQSMACPFAFMRKAPTAKPYVVRAGFKRVS